MGFHRRTATLLITLVLVCSLIPLAVVTYVSITDAEDAVENEVHDQLRAEVEGIAESTETNADASIEQARILASQKDIVELATVRQETEDVEERDEYDRALEYTRLLEEDESVRRAVVYWEDGNSLAGYQDGEPVDDNRGEMEWFQETLSEVAIDHGEVRASHLSMSHAINEPVIRYTSPVEVDGERVGVALVTYEAAEVLEPVEQLQIGDDGYGMMVTPVYSTADGDVLGSLFVANGANPDVAFDEDQAGDLYIPDELLGGDSGSITYDHQGESWHAEYQRAHIGAQEYYVLATIPVSEVQAPAVAIRNQGLLIGGVAGLIIVLVSVVATRTFTAPITQLAADARAVADGDTDREIVQSSLTTELQLLTESTRAMKENVVSALSDAETQRKSAEQRQQEAEAAKQEAEQAKREAEQLSDHLEEKAQTFGQTMDRAADGDLTQRMNPESQSEAMTEIAQSFNEMMREFEATIQRIQTFATDVAASSEEVTASTEESKNASEQVSNSVQEISADAESQSDNLQEVSSEMQSLSGTVEEVASSAEEIATKSEQAAELGRDGRESATDAMTEMNAIEAKSEETSTEIESLASEIDEIGEIVELIRSIAEQTNMLALNASIEAERAGAAGEGFAVVADEIKQLAEEVSDATADVEKRIDEIQSSADTAVTDIREMGERVTAGTETIETSLEALEEIAASVEEVNESIQEVRHATDDQASSTEEVASMLDEVASAAEQVSAESANVSAAAQEQTSSLTEVSESAQTLATQAEELHELLAQFEIED